MMFFFGSQFQLPFTYKTRTLSRGSAETLFGWDGKLLYYCMANSIRTMCTKICQHWPGFAENM